MTALSPKGCHWCGCVDYHAEACEGFAVNDPAAALPPKEPTDRWRCEECGTPWRSGWTQCMRCGNSTRDKEPTDDRL